MDDDVMFGDWSQLQGDLLGLILDKLKTTLPILDYIRFGSVCFEWRSLSVENYEHIKLPSKLPVLMILLAPLTEEEEEEKHDDPLTPLTEEEEEEKQDDPLTPLTEEEEEKHDDPLAPLTEEEEEKHDDPLAPLTEEEEEEQYDDEDDNDNDNDDEEEEEEHDQMMYYYNPKVIWRGQDQTRHKSTRSFYSISQGKIYQDFQLPVPYYKNCRGSSHGWLITIDEEEQLDGTYSYPVRLFNPFRSLNNNEIQLPPLTPILGDEPNCSYYLSKAYLSANPSSLTNLANLIVFGIYGINMFVFCRPGDIAWTYLPLEDRFRSIQDLICYKGRFRAITKNGSVLDLDFAHHLPEPTVTFVARPPVNGNSFNRKYLVESGGNLLQVQRDKNNDDHSTIGFRAFKLNDDDKWVEMDNLDGHMLFLGNNSSISIAATDFPNLMPNCIYFTDDNYIYYEHWFGTHDNGVFNFEDKNFEDYNCHLMPPAIWIRPML